MKKILMMSIFLFMSKVIRSFDPYRKATIDLTKLKVSIWYLESIKTMRLLFISLLGVGVCLVFLMSGLILFHLAILFYAPWGIEIKMGITLMFALGYIVTAIGLFYYFFSEDKWIKIFHADELIRKFSDLSGEMTKENEELESSYK